MVLLWGFFGVLLVWALFQSAKSNDARRKARPGFLDLCLPLFTHPITAVAETGFARISGQYRGQMFDLQVVPDSLSLRKLPCLWLLITVAEPLPVDGTYDVMLRATGAETFSRFGEWPSQIDTPACFPEGCTIRTDAVGPMPAAMAVGHYLSGQDKARLKELVVAQKGLRLVWLLEEADRGRYLLYRDAEMGSQALQADVVLPLMDGLCTLWGDVMAQVDPHG